MTRLMLERKGYRVLPAGSPTEAISLAKAHEGVIHLLITDVVMPERILFFRCGGCWMNKLRKACSKSVKQLMGKGLFA